MTAPRNGVRLWAVIFAGGTTVRDLIVLRESEPDARYTVQWLIDLEIDMPTENGAYKAPGRAFDVVPVDEEAVMDALVNHSFSRKLPLFPVTEGPS